MTKCWVCPATGSLSIIGHNGTAPTDVRYAYVNMFWSGNILNFYAERLQNNGAVVSAPPSQHMTR
ncbi:hypothetical protein NVIE_1349 [Nitrososphaera viennensis EN76]|uniref:Uncharacterized protein n=1 Tax=Nitrososphaera viennensis EN76 TaxID=926571 RepID=A0A060HQW4_9ARCH|nr:hypothetical protein NVIE_1349 [Nitrososphaera viennensis EN76]